MKILLVDDDKDLCHLTRTALIRHGHEVAAFHDAGAGIKHAQNIIPDLILMDVMLPGIGGAEAVSALKADPRLMEVPVVFLTALVSGRKDNFEEINVNGAQYMTLGKPYEIETLLGVIRSFEK